nr:hypothetical protein [Kribbella turkmenica]
MHHDRRPDHRRTGRPSDRSRSIGYTNKPGKADDLTADGADAVIANIAELTQAVQAN